LGSGRTTRFAVRVSAVRLARVSPAISSRARRCRVHRIPRSTFVTTRTPLLRVRGGRTIGLIWFRKKRNIFHRGTRRQISLKCQAKFCLRAELFVCAPGVERGLSRRLRVGFRSRHYVAPRNDGGGCSRESVNTHTHVSPSAVLKTSPRCHSGARRLARARKSCPVSAASRYGRRRGYQRQARESYSCKESVTPLHVRQGYLAALRTARAKLVGDLVCGLRRSRPGHA
jgi:hypothetical protein